MSPISRPSAAYYDDNYGYGPAGSNRPCVVPRRYPRGPVRGHGHRHDDRRFSGTREMIEKISDADEGLSAP